MKRYSKREYEKYKTKVDKTIGKAISFEKWKVIQPIADSIIGKTNKIIIKNKEEKII